MSILPPRRTNERSEFDPLYSAPLGSLCALKSKLCAHIGFVPGGTIGELVKGFSDAGFELHLARSEMGAGYYALGLALSTGLPALTLTVGGAAAAALAQPLWCARLRGAPVVAITGEVRTGLAGRGAVQDGTGHDGPSLTALLAAVTWRSVAAVDREAAWRELLLCIELAVLLRGPTHLSVPQDVQQELLGRTST